MTAVIPHNMHPTLNQGSQTHSSFLDFSKAFEKKSHKLILYKLSAVNIDPNILFWLERLVTNRSQLVTVNGNDSLPVSVNSGVPKGSVLGPCLFLIHINDFPTQVPSSI